MIFMRDGEPTLGGFTEIGANLVERFSLSMQPGSAGIEAE